MLGTAITLKIVNPMVAPMTESNRSIIAPKQRKRRQLMRSLSEYELDLDSDSASDNLMLPLTRGEPRSGLPSDAAAC